jgi:hypothetical protein
MIFGVHSHAHKYPDCCSESLRRQAIRMSGYEIDLTSRFRDFGEIVNYRDRADFFAPAVVACVVPVPALGF